jgi:autotransporter adhesin
VAIGGGDDTSNRGARADGIRSIAIGQKSLSSVDGYGTALGYNTNATFAATAVGTDASAAGDSSTAIGRFAAASGTNATASGTASSAVDEGSAYGHTSSAGASGTSAFGAGSTASAAQASAFGQNALASGGQGIALGYNSKATGSSGTAVGASAKASGGNGIAAGVSSTAGGLNSAAVGRLSDAAGANSLALAFKSEALAANSIAIGMSAVAGGNGSATSTIAIGAGATATASKAISIGYGSVGDVANALSVGAAGSERRIVHVAAAVKPTDAVNLSQVKSLIAASTIMSIMSAQMRPRHSYGPFKDAFPVSGIHAETQAPRTATLTDDVKSIVTESRDARDGTARSGSASCHLNASKMAAAVHHRSAASSTFGRVEQSGVSFIQGLHGCAAATFTADIVLQGNAAIEIRAALDDGEYVSPWSSYAPASEEPEQPQTFSFLFANVAPGPHQIDLQFRNAGKSGVVRIGQRMTHVQYVRSGNSFRSQRPDRRD